MYHFFYCRHAYVDDAYLLLFPLGFLGLHHAYLNRPCWFILYFCTFGCLGVGWIIDFFRLPSMVREYNEKMENQLVAHGYIQEPAENYNTEHIPNPVQEQEKALAIVSPEYQQQTPCVYPSLSASGKLHISNFILQINNYIIRITFIHQILSGK